MCRSVVDTNLRFYLGTSDGLPDDHPPTFSGPFPWSAGTRVRLGGDGTAVWLGDVSANGILSFYNFNPGKKNSSFARSPMTPDGVVF